MTDAALLTLKTGWKVFAGSEELGTITDVGDDAITVQKGTLIKKEYRVPRELISSTEDGIVDLKVERDELERLQQDATADAPPKELPEEFRRVELGESQPPERDPRDPFLM